MKGFGDIMKQVQKVKGDMAELQERLAEERFECGAGAGLVRVVVDGRQKVLQIKLDPSLLAEKDVTLIEDLVLTALGEAQEKSEKRMHEALKKLTGGLPLPF